MSEVEKKQNGEQSLCVYIQRVSNSGQIELKTDG